MFTMTEGGSDVSPDPASSTFALSSAPGVLQRGTDPSQDNMLPVPSVNCAHAKGGIKATNMNANIFLTHSEGLGSLTDGVIYTTQRYSKESTIATPRRPNSSSEPQSNRCVRKDPHRFLRPKRGGMTPWSRRRGAPTSAVKGDLYDRSIKSCAQQLKMSSVSKQNGDRNQPEQRPTTTTKRGGIGLEFLAFRDKFTEVAVRQAKAQVLLANHAVRELHDGHAGVPLVHTPVCWVLKPLIVVVKVEDSLPIVLSVLRCIYTALTPEHATTTAT